jgi:putative transposase
LEVTEAKRLRTLGEESAKLKKILAKAMRDIAVLKEISSKKW